VDLERRFEAKANWVYVRELTDRIAALESWRESAEAVSQWRRWVLPVLLSAIGAAVAVLGALSLTLHH
jgi:hypothetical protein